MKNNPIKEILGAYNLSPSRAVWEFLGDLLGNLSRGKPYSWRYIQSLYSETVEICEPILRGVQAALAEADGTNPILARSKIATVFTPTEIDVDGAFIFFPAKICQSENCNIRFISNHPSRKFCPNCRPSRRKL